MINIEHYMSGEIEYDALSDAERCAICAAMEGEFAATREHAANQTSPTRRSLFLWDYETYRIDRSPSYGTNLPAVYDYLSDGTAALRLVERFKLMLQPASGDWACYPVNSFGYETDDAAYGDTPAAAIVACVCDLAKAQWPYKKSPASIA